MLPMFVRSRPPRTRRTISPSWARSDMTTKSMAKPSTGRASGVIRAGGTLVTIAGPPEARPADGLAVDFVVVPDRAQLSEVVRRVRDARLRTNIGSVATLDDAVAACNPTERISGQTIIRVRP